MEDKESKGDFRNSNSTFLVFESRDEREAHYFMLSDPLYKEQLLKSHELKELDFVHAKREDELVVTSKFS